MITIVLNNTTYGAFILSKMALKELGWQPEARFPSLDTPTRSDSKLIAVCKKLGDRALEGDGKCTFVDIEDEDVPYVVFNNRDFENFYIDYKAKTRAHLEDVVSAARSIISCGNLNANEKIAILATILK